MAKDLPQSWLSLTQMPDVRGLAGALTARWNLWVGLVTPAGNVVPIRGQNLAVGGPSLPVCRAFMRRGDEVGDCAYSLMSWAQRRGSGLMRCHAGLYGVVETVHVPALGHAALYASGLIEAERAVDPIAGLLDRAESLGLVRAQVADGLESMPRLDEAGREAVALLLASMRRAIEEAAATSAASRPPRRHDYSQIVGQSPSVLRLFGLMDRVVENDSTVLIHGENGTGKELFARAIHNNSGRRERVFVTQNCAAINDNLLESELFGHRRGSFTGAIANKRGLFDMADGGTLFLDEVGDMTPTMQVKLLRVLQEGTFVPVGDTVTHRVDVRIIAASNRNLDTMVRERSFREDLFYRLNVISLYVPELRERRDDIPLLVEHFLRDYARRTGRAQKTLAPEAIGVLAAWDWPGNVRELRHEVERLFVLSGESVQIEVSLISPRILEGVEPAAARLYAAETTTLPEAVEALERRMIREALEQTGWNKTRAAARLGVSRRNLIRKVQAWGLEVVEERE